jgi:hypothetical protein
MNYIQSTLDINTAHGTAKSGVYIKKVFISRVDCIGRFLDYINKIVVPDTDPWCVTQIVAR